jgi:lysophospholipase L1-like esterase
MRNIKERYLIVPQMELYDQITCDYRPFVMFFNGANFSSKFVNTDDLGFRLNIWAGELKKNTDFFNCKEVSIVIGGSCVFGFGATSDEKTISSQLSKKTNHIYLNFGATAFNSKQEILLFLNFFKKYKKIKNVIIISGANDIFLNLLNNHDEWGDFFFKNKYSRIHDSYKKRKRVNLDLINYFTRILKKKTKKLSENNKDLINYKNVETNYDEIFSLWKTLSNAYNFNLKIFLQPIPSWLNKPLSIEEKKLFTILDNSNDKAHINLKKLSSIDNYNNFLSILEKISKKHNVDFIDLNKELLNIKNIDKWLFVDRVHMTNQGYEDLAEIVLKNI